MKKFVGAEETIKLIENFEKKNKSEAPKGKQFVCFVCGKGYGDKTSLRYHFLTHNNENEFLCTFCEILYTTKDFWVVTWRFR